jgi:hypothetical protein
VQAMFYAGVEIARIEPRAGAKAPAIIFGGARKRSPWGGEPKVGRSSHTFRQRIPMPFFYLGIGPRRDEALTPPA